MENEHLDTISATESDEFIKSSVENLVPTPIEFEDFSDDECDLPPYDDSSKNHDSTFSNPLFDIDEDFTLSDEWGVWLNSANHKLVLLETIWS
ncbi:hypothetical protein Tco_0834230 [Tanacetum coccineum]